MKILSIVHEEDTQAGVFGEVIADRGHELVTWPIAAGAPTPGTPEEHDAVLILGGTMHPDQDDSHPWLAEEVEVVRRLADLGVPTIGMCLGGQVIARALGAQIERAPEPEIGWPDVELTPEAATDPLFRNLPRCFPACQWHSYSFRLPPGAVALATSPICLQAFRADEVVWGLQFHAEVDRDSLAYWIDHFETDPDAVRFGFDQVAAMANLDSHIESWNALGRELASRFLDVAERRAA